MTVEVSREAQVQWLSLTSQRSRELRILLGVSLIVLLGLPFMAALKAGCSKAALQIGESVVCDASAHSTDVLDVRARLGGGSAKAGRSTSAQLTQDVALFGSGNHALSVDDSEARSEGVGFKFTW